MAGSFDAVLREVGLHPDDIAADDPRRPSLMKCIDDMGGLRAEVATHALEPLTDDWTFAPLARDPAPPSLRLGPYVSVLEQDIDTWSGDGASSELGHDAALAEASQEAVARALERSGPLG